MRQNILGSDTMGCNYSELLGKPGEGVHAWRLFPTAFDGRGVAGVDVLITVGAAAAFATRRKANALAWFIVALLVLLASSVALHSAFCVDTPLTQWVAGGVKDAGSWALGGPQLGEGEGRSL